MTTDLFVGNLFRQPHRISESRYLSAGMIPPISPAIQNLPLHPRDRDVFHPFAIAEKGVLRSGSLD